MGTRGRRDDATYLVRALSPFHPYLSAISHPISETSVRLTPPRPARPGALSSSPVHCSNFCSPVRPGLACPGGPGVTTNK